MKRFIFLPLLLLWPPAAIACDCESLSLAQRVDLADAVFLGEVVSHKPDSIELKVLEPYKSNPITQIAVPTEILKAFKGGPDARITVSTGQSMCDYFLPSVGKPGERFLIFIKIQRDGPKVWLDVNRCFGTKPENASAEDIKWLRDYGVHHSQVRSWTQSLPAVETRANK